MKKLALFLTLLFILSLCACGAPKAPAQETEKPAVTGETPAPQDTQKPAEEPETQDTEKPEAEPETQEPAESQEPESQPEPGPSEPEAIPVTGLYNLYAVEISGEQRSPTSLSVSSTISLLDDGTGVISVNGGETPFSKWEEADGTLSLTSEDGEVVECTVEDGFITLQMAEDYYWLFAHEATGVVDEEAARMAASKVHALYERIDGNSGAHLNYEFHTDYLDATSIRDVHARNGIYYSARTVETGGVSVPSASGFQDGTAYVLYPDKKTGTVATTTGSSLISGNVLLLDELYQEIYAMAQRGDYTVETREVDGVSYTCEVFPESSYEAETVFCYDEAGTLVHVLKAPSPMFPDLGETVYTIHAIDASVDDALLDFSGYTIEE